MSLDLDLARAIHVNRILERAVHAPTGWTIALGDVHLPVVREKHDRGVNFTTHVPGVEVQRPLILGLYHQGELQDCREVRPGEQLAEIVWELHLATPVVA